MTFGRGRAASDKTCMALSVQRIGLYLQGRNSDRQRITQTVPVSAYFNKKGDFEEGRNYSIALYIPKDVQVSVIAECQKCASVSMHSGKKWLHCWDRGELEMGSAWSMACKRRRVVVGLGNSHVRESLGLPERRQTVLR